MAEKHVTINGYSYVAAYWRDADRAIRESYYQRASEPVYRGFNNQLLPSYTGKTVIEQTVFKGTGFEVKSNGTNFYRMVNLKPTPYGLKLLPRILDVDTFSSYTSIISVKTSYDANEIFCGANDSTNNPKVIYAISERGVSCSAYGALYDLTPSTLGTSAFYTAQASGIYHYDGTSWQTITSAMSFAKLTYHNGYLFGATPGKGTQFYRIDPSDGSLLQLFDTKQEEISDICSHQNGIIFATKSPANAKIYFYDGFDVYPVIDAFPGNFTITSIISYLGNLYIAGTYDNEISQKVVVYRDDEEFLTLPTFYNKSLIPRLTVASETLYVATGYQLFCYDFKEETMYERGFYNSSEDRSFEFCAVANDYLYVFCIRNGILVKRRDYPDSIHLSQGLLISSFHDAFSPHDYKEWLTLDVLIEGERGIPNYVAYLIYPYRSNPYLLYDVDGDGFPDGHYWGVDNAYLPPIFPTRYVSGGALYDTLYFKYTRTTTASLNFEMEFFDKYLNQTHKISLGQIPPDTVTALPSGTSADFYAHIYPTNPINATYTSFVIGNVSEPDFFPPFGPNTEGLLCPFYSYFVGGRESSAASTRIIGNHFEFGVSGSCYPPLSKEIGVAIYFFPEMLISSSEYYVKGFRIQGIKKDILEVTKSNIYELVLLIYNEPGSSIDADSLKNNLKTLYENGQSFNYTHIDGTEKTCEITSLEFVNYPAENGDAAFAIVVLRSV